MKERKRIRLLKRGVTSFALALAVAVPAMPGATADPVTRGTGKVTVVHAIPQLTVDVYVDDELFLEDFAPGTIAGPVKLPSASYDIEITPANSDEVALSASATLEEGGDVSAVAHLNADGDPSLSFFANDVRAVEHGKARVTVRHAAAAPAVDVRYKRRASSEWRTFASNVTVGEEATKDIRIGPKRFDVVLAGTNERVLGPAKPELEKNMHLFVYAWGSAEAGNLGLLFQDRKLPRSCS